MAKKKEKIDEKSSFEILNIDDVKYKTRLTKKFRERVKYQPHDPKKITAFIPGTIVGIFTKKGKKVAANDKLLALEAMKMVNEVFTPIDGVVKKIYVKEGEVVTKNQLLLELK